MIDNHEEGEPTNRKKTGGGTTFSSLGFPLHVVGDLAITGSPDPDGAKMMSSGLIKQTGNLPCLLRMRR